MSRFPITCQRLREEAKKGDMMLLNTLNILSYTGDNPHLWTEWRSARHIAQKLGWADALAELDADPVAMPVSAPLQAEAMDPEERAFDEGAEARANEIHRSDNPYTGDLAEAWLEGWESGDSE